MVSSDVLIVRFQRNLRGKDQKYFFVELIYIEDGVNRVHAVHYMWRMDNG